MTYADIVKPVRNSSIAVYNACLVLGGSIILAVSAQIAFPLPFSPVPISLQTMAVLSIGVLLGAKRAFLAVSLYLLEGICVLPVFANGASGIVYLLGATGGYLLGFIPAATLVGWMAEKKMDRKFRSALLAMLLGEVVIFSCGIAWLAIIFGGEKALLFGLFPFIPGEIVKIILAGFLLPVGWKLGLDSKTK